MDRNYNCKYIKLRLGWICHIRINHMSVIMPNRLLVCGPTYEHDEQVALPSHHNLPLPGSPGEDHSYKIPVLLAEVKVLIGCLDGTNFQSGFISVCLHNSKALCRKINPGHIPAESCQINGIAAHT